jgi:hypothetical protein
MRKLLNTVLALGIVASPLPSAIEVYGKSPVSDYCEDLKTQEEFYKNEYNTLCIPTKKTPPKIIKQKKKKKIIHKQPVVPEQKTIQKPAVEQKKSQLDNGVSLILQYNGNKKTDGAGIGLQYTPVKYLGFATLFNFNKAHDEKIFSYLTPGFKGTFGDSKTYRTNAYSLGASFELECGIPLSKEVMLGLIGGAGFNYWNWVEKTKESIYNGSLPLKSNTNSVPESKFTENFYGGLELKFKNKFGIRFIAGHDSIKHGRKGTYFGAGLTFRLNK